MRPVSTDSMMLGALLTAVLTLGCNSKPESRLNGRWVVDVEAMVTRETLKDTLAGLDPAAQEQRLAAARAEAGRIGLEIDSGKLVVDTGLDRTETRFVARAEGEVVLLDTDDGHGRKDTVRCSFQGDRLQMTWGETPLLLVKR
jgi:hypothetical protein